MTTIPTRIDEIRPVIEAVLAQSVPIERLELNIPYKCIRTNEPYTIPMWLDGMDRVMIFRTEDYGSITKVAPTFLRYQTIAILTFGQLMMIAPILTINWNCSVVLI